MASIKRNVSGETSGSAGPRPGGRFVMVNMPIARLVRSGYPALTATQIAGAPDWTNTERYDVTALAGREASAAELQEMIRGLLIERFKFAAHFESRESDVFALGRARADGRLARGFRRTAIDCADIAENRPGNARDLTATSSGAPPCGLLSDGQKLVSGGITMPQLARIITPLVGRIVVDRTELDGYYEFTLEYAVARGNAARVPDAADQRPSIFAALQEQLGLKLEPARAGVDVLVIDAIERPSPD